MSVEDRTFALGGGLDLITPAMMVPSGRAIFAENYEPEVRGYRRIGGYERMDGREKPSTAAYWTLAYRNGTAAFSEGDIVTGQTSGATGRVLASATAATGRLALAVVTGTFVEGENLRVGGVTRAIADAGSLIDGEPDETLRRAYQAAAIAYARSLIQPVPGSGPVRGTVTYRGTIYAWRDNVGATACAMWRATSSGWQAVGNYRTINFSSGGPTEILPLQTITGATSGISAVVRRVILQSGTWPGGDAAGYLVIDNHAGSFVAENLNVGASLNVATVAANSTAITLPAGGRYDFLVKNFFGAAQTERLYFTNGVGYAHEFDGTTLVPIKVPGLDAATDKPNHIGERSSHLFLSYASGTLMFSGIVDPVVFTVLTGAGEISVGNPIVGMVDSAKTALIIICRSQVHYVTGTDSTTFQRLPISDRAGGVEWTVQSIGEPAFLDQIGVRRLSATQEFGDWRVGSLTQAVEPLFKAKAKAGVTAVGSMCVASKDQYRLFFSDGSGLVIYLGRKTPEVMPFKYPTVATCCWVGRDVNDREIALLGDASGYLYEVDAGTSFDGAAIPFVIRFPFNHVGSPRSDKRWHLAVLEVDAAPNTKLGIIYEVSYANPDVQTAPESQDFSLSGGGGFWNEANWDEFYWSSSVQGQAEARLEAVGSNISIAVLGEASDEEPHTLSTLTLHYSPRRRLR
ncbi:MAG: hypothetical protein ACK50Q_18560 [Labrys sp. (in: a-proteobacteria)]